MAKSTKQTYQRKDGRFRKKVTVGGVSKYIYGKTAAEMWANIEKFKSGITNGPGFSSFSDDWLESVRRDLSPNTVNNSYTPIINKLQAYFGDQLVSSITPANINAYVLQMPRASRDGHVSRKTVNNHLGVLRQLMDRAVVAGWLTSNPCESVRIPKSLKSGKRGRRSAAQIQAVIDHAGDDLISLLAFFVMVTGLRKGEALALTWGDLRWDDRLITVNKSVYFNGNAPRIKRPKTAAGVREVLLPDILVNYLHQGNKPKTAYIFTFDPTGKKPLLKSQFYDNFARYQVNNGLIGVGLHVLRHTYASMLYDRGVDVKTAQALLGHADISTTQNIYTHLLEARQRREYAALNTYFDDNIKK